MARSDAHEKRRETVKRKGAEAFAQGLPESACPYQDHRQDSGKLTWSRAYRNDWVQGWRWARDAAKKTN
jgi:hypothetical protein